MEGSSFFQRLKRGLTKSRETWVQNIGAIFQNRRWDETSLDEMEETLHRRRCRRQAPLKKSWRPCGGNRPAAAKTWRRGNVVAPTSTLIVEHAPRLYAGAHARSRSRCKPWIILFLGVNGVGKTTTIGKLAAQYRTPAKKFSLSPATPFVPPPSNNLMSGASARGSTSLNIGPAPTLRPWFSTACKPPRVAARTFC